MACGFSLARSMGPSLCILLCCLRLCLGQSRQGKSVATARPVLTIEPSRLTQRGSFVMLSCLAPVWANLFQLQKEGPHPLKEEKEPNDSLRWNQATFFIMDVMATSAGLYTCRFRREAHWSLLSVPVELVVTGMYPSPVFWAEPGEVVQEGKDVKFLCHSTLNFHEFVVTKDKNPFLKMRNNNSNHQQQISFRIRSVTKAHAGTYYCYGHSAFYRQLWSYPSKALILEVTDAVSSILSIPTFYSLVQVSLGGLSLLFFGRLVVKALIRSQKRRKPPGTGKNPV